MSDEPRAPNPVYDVREDPGWPYNGGNDLYLDPCDWFSPSPERPDICRDCGVEEVEHGD